jgi:predicted XRE-type DNA-binding protein
MRINEGTEIKIIKLLDHTGMSYTEIADAVGVPRKDVQTYVRRRLDDVSLSDDELACCKPTTGFLYYLQGREQ